MPQDSFFDIDRYNLDTECISLPIAYHEASMQMVEAQKEYDIRKAEMELAEAELDADIRLNPERFNIPKITETVIEKAIVTTKRYQRTQKALLEAKHALDVCRVHVASLEVKKRSLEMLVQLDGRDYFSEPKVPASVREKMEEKEKKAIRSKGQYRKM